MAREEPTREEGEQRGRGSRRGSRWQRCDDTAEVEGGVNLSGGDWKDSRGGERAARGESVNADRPRRRTATRLRRQF